MKSQRLHQHLSPLAVWAFAMGTSIGWGSLVVTANSYLGQAGPAGSVLGLVVAAAIMLVIGWNYAHLMQAYPEAGGAYAFMRHTFGYDQGFLAAWFLAMTYLAVLWANATSLPLFGRIFLGGVFRVGKLYTIFGYDVFAGEALLSSAAIVLTGLLLMRLRKLTDIIMIALAFLFTAGILVCFIGGMAGGNHSMEPAYLPDSTALAQIVKIAVISPWAFIGFESVSHSAEEFNFDHRRIPGIMIIVVLSVMAIYAMVTILSVTAYPPEYGSWLDYIRDLDNLEGIKALPAFYAANAYLGAFGVALLMLALLALVITSLIGNTTALSRLFYALAKDRILPEGFGELNHRNIPAKAVLLVVALSIFVPLIGRTAIGWIVDVTTIGATLIYAMVSACAARLGQEREEKNAVWMGRLGLGVMIAFGAYILIPNLVSSGSMATETYFLFIVWTALGFLFFRSILHRDKDRRFGSSIIVWIAMLALILFVALIWMRQSMFVINDTMLDNIRTFSEQQAAGSSGLDERYILDQIAAAQDQDARTILIAIAMFAFALVIMMTNHSYMNKKSLESEKLANIDPLTGVKSKHAYLVQEKEIDQAIGEGETEAFSIVVCDVNGLKKINDTLGHKAGDKYIQEACQMVCDVFQHSPVFRIGGDEFVVILKDRDYVIRNELTLALHDRSVEHISSGGAVISAGLSDYRPGEDTCFHDVFERADERMYEEKQLLKGLGAVTRDDSSEENDAFKAMVGEEKILNVRKKILIVDDEVINQMILQNMLAEAYDVLLASDGVEALEQVKGHRDELGLVLLDLQMPKMSGIDVLKVMKEEEELRRIPVIVLTAEESAEVECLKIGAADFIPKPYPDQEIIMARVNRCIELSEDRDIIQSTERDPLTRLFNIDYFRRYVQKHDQHYPSMSMDAVVADLNRFHILNERYGKQYGDVILRRLGDQIRQFAREVGGVGCRSAADIFYIYCPHREEYEGLLQRLSEGLVDDESQADRVSLRLGVYTDADKSLSIERRFDHARIAANAVKNGVGIYDAGMHEQELYRARLLEDFRSSLDQQRFRVYYQPKFDIRPQTPILSSAEALVRWDHPDLGLLSPSVFIPLLEENGLILELDRYVWEQAAGQIRTWKQKHGFSIPVSVNVSRADMLHPDLKTILRQILDTWQLDPRDLILEITESAYTGDADQVIAMARELRSGDLGLRIEMDDFGVGYSSLGMLTHLPIDALKLDMSFIRSAFGEMLDLRMIQLIIDIAGYLQVPLIAEGVETEEQYLALKDMGCDLVQGYYFSKPVAPEEFDRFLTEGRGRNLTGDGDDEGRRTSGNLTGGTEIIYDREEQDMDRILIIRDGEDVSKEDLLADMAAQLDFPDYFGNNYDAFRDCLEDVQGPLLVRFPHPEEGFRSEAVRILCEIVKEVAGEKPDLRIEYIESDCISRNTEGGCEND